MNKCRKFLLSILFILLLFSCSNNQTNIDFRIVNDSGLQLEIGNTLQLEFNEGIDTDKISYTSDSECIKINEDGLVTGLKIGTVTITAKYESVVVEYSLEVIENNHITIELSTNNSQVYVGDSVILKSTVTPALYKNEVEYVITEGRENGRLEGNIIQTLQEGQIKVISKVKGFESNELTITIESKEITEDPYVDVNKTEFYANYVPAKSYLDAYYRTLHGLMSGSIEPQDDDPTISEYQPQEDGKYLKNTSSLYSNDGNTYYILDCYGEVTNQIYRGGAYVTLEEVAAYVLAFNDIPANYTTSKRTSPSTSIWKEYLRVNHSKFSGDTSRYPYEPELPNISGCGGEYQYYELDLGTTGTDTGGNYAVAVYNDGNKITRGAARIVYSRFDRNGNDIIDFDEKYVFYTHNHYNDFREYLNYEGGWGEMFGNITGGGELSSKYNYNPTPYVAVITKDFSSNSYMLVLSINQTLDQLIVYYNKYEMKKGQHSDMLTL